MLDGVCACNRQERTHTLRGFGTQGGGGAWRTSKSSSWGLDSSLDRISDEIGRMGQGSQRPDLDVQVTRDVWDSVMLVMGLSGACDLSASGVVESLGVVLEVVLLSLLPLEPYLLRPEMRTRIAIRTTNQDRCSAKHCPLSLPYLA